MCKFHWKDHTSFVMKNIANLYKHGLFVDCTVNVEGKSVRVHKNVLAATSPYFEQLLKDHPNKKTFELNEMKYQDFKSVLEFIYFGITEISSGEEQSFFKVANFLQLQIPKNTDFQHEDSELVEVTGQKHCAMENSCRVVSDAESCRLKDSLTHPLPSDSLSSTFLMKSKKEESIPRDESNVNILQRFPVTGFCEGDEILSTGEKICPKDVSNSSKTSCTMTSGSTGLVREKRDVKYFRSKEEETTGEKGTSTTALQKESTRGLVSSSNLLHPLQLRHSPSSVNAFSSMTSSDEGCRGSGKVEGETSEQRESKDAQSFDERSSEKSVVPKMKEESFPDKPPPSIPQKSGKKLKKKGSISRHLNDGKMGFVCKICGKVFQRRDTLNVHVRIHFPNKSFSCNVCGKPFSRRGNLQTHFRIHSGEKPYSCKDCGKSFSQQGSLKAHIRIHSGDKPYLCEDCGKSFARGNNLREHEKIHSGALPFPCRECGKSFSQHGSLQAHIRTHTGDKPFLCEDCGKSFSQSGSLRTHMRTHSGDKPFSCEDCGKSFSRQCNLQRHRRIHSGEKPFSCQVCGKSFTQQGSLKAHMRIHSGD